MIFDDSWTNVALNKPVTSSAQAPIGSAAAGNDGMVDIPVDQVSGNQVRSSTTTDHFWTVDLGAVSRDKWRLRGSGSSLRLVSSLRLLG